MADIVGIGCAVHDMILIMDHFPEEDSKCGARDSIEQSGGPCCVAMVTASKLGVGSAFLGNVGDDTSGAVIRNSLTRFGVDISGLGTVEGGMTPFVIVISAIDTSSRTCIGTMGGKIVKPIDYPPEQLDLSVLHGAKYLHLDGVNADAAIRAARYARETGVKVSLDADGAAMRTEELLEYADVLIPAERFAVHVTGLSDPEEAAWALYRKYQPEILAVTQGPRGGILITEGRLSHYPAFSVDALDTNGAGDVFHGAFIAALVKGLSAEQAAVYASAASAIKCTRYGACEGTPDEETLLSFLREHGYDFPAKAE